MREYVVMFCQIIYKARFFILFITCGVMVLVTSESGEIERQYPWRPLTNVVVWAAGGGTDIANRVVSSTMSEILGTDIAVTNKDGGVAGSLGLSYADSRKSDGYTLVGISESILSSPVMGGFAKPVSNWFPFIIGGSPIIVSVAGDSEFSSVGELMDFAQKSSEPLKVSASSFGSVHYLNYRALISSSNGNFQFVPFPGSSPAQTAVITHEVDVVITSLSEQQPFIQSGTLKPLAVMDVNDLTLSAGIVKSITTTLPELRDKLPIPQLVGFALKNDTPEDVKQVIKGAFEEAISSEEVIEWASANAITLSGKSGDVALEQLQHLESVFSWTLFEENVATYSPDLFHIKPPFIAKDAR